MSRSCRLAGLGLLLVGAAACRDEAGVPPAVLRLMECIECSAGELTAVIALGDTAVPALRAFLLNGPPPESVDRMRRRLVELVGGATVSPAVGGTAVAVVDRQLGEYVGLYRSRAALGLGGVATASARAALCAGQAAGRGDVVDSALVQVGGAPCP